MLRVDRSGLRRPTCINKLEASENSIHQEAPGNVAFEWQIGDEKEQTLFLKKRTKLSQWKSQITELLLTQWSLGVVMLNGIKNVYIFL